MKSRMFMFALILFVQGLIFGTLTSGIGDLKEQIQATSVKSRIVIRQEREGENLYACVNTTVYKFIKKEGKEKTWELVTDKNGIPVNCEEVIQESSKGNPDA